MTKRSREIKPCECMTQDPLAVREAHTITVVLTLTLPSPKEKAKGSFISGFVSDDGGWSTAKFLKIKGDAILRISIPQSFKCFLSC